SFSRRTIQYCVKSINEEYPNLITSSRNGFKIVSKQQLSSILSNSQVIDIPQTEADRKTLILKSLLFTNESKDLDELAQELFISPSTLNNELIKIKLELSEFDLIFKTKSNVASIEGLEKNKKKMISSLIYKDTKDNFMNLDSMQKYLPMFDLHRVKKIVTDNLKLFEFFIDDFSLLNFVLHIAITMERNKLDNHLSIKKSTQSSNTIISSHINQIIQTIIDDIEKEYSIVFSESDCYDLALLIMTRVIN
ncbi:MAG: helix-turn-helix domain-containing protein, partial [Erysipelotrichaceae bacterium]